MLGSHLPISRKHLGDFVALLRDLQSPINLYNEKEVVKHKTGVLREQSRDSRAVGALGMQLNCRVVV